MQDISIKDKIGQMLILGFDGQQFFEQSTIAQDILKVNLGGVILFDYDFPSKTFNKNISSSQQLKQLTDQLQQYTRQAQTQKQRSRLPLFISIDCEGGRVNRLSQRHGFAEYPSAKAQAMLSDDKANELYALMANTLRQLGINLNFAPVIDLALESNPIITALDRGFDADPQVVAKLADRMISVFIDNKVSPVVKHFPGHGSSVTDSHLELVNVTQSWSNKELKPYQLLIEKYGADCLIMVGHIINKQLDGLGLPASLSKAMLTDLLRGVLGYQGLIVSDDLQMKAITNHYSLAQTLTLAINAGVDLLIFGNQLSEQKLTASDLVEMIYQLIQQGEIEPQKVDMAYQRIINAKQRTL